LASIYDNQEFITLFSGEEIAKEITLIRDDAVDKINRNIERINKFVNNKVNFLIDLSHKINQFKADDFQLTHISDRSLERLDHVDKILLLVNRIKNSNAHIAETNTRFISSTSASSSISTTLTRAGRPNVIRYTS
jgi:hypothetical protein